MVILQWGYTPPRSLESGFQMTLWSIKTIFKSP